MTDFKDILDQANKQEPNNQPEKTDGKPAGTKYTISLQSGHKCYLRKPTFTELSLFVTTTQQKGAMIAAETMLNTLWLGGDEIVKKDDDLLASACFAIDEVIDIQKATVEKH